MAFEKEMNSPILMHKVECMCVWSTLIIIIFGFIALFISSLLELSGIKEENQVF